MTPITDEVIDQAEAIGAISFEMSGRVRAELTALRARLTAAEAEVGRLREVTDALRNYVAHYPECPRAKFAGDCSCGLHNYLARYAALAASPVTEPQAAQAGEREQVAEALIAWADEECLDEFGQCVFCYKTISFHGTRYNNHSDSCLHLRAKALRAIRADVGGSEAGGGL